MRNISTCYNEHAVRVSDSYCSGPLLNRSNYNYNYISPKSIPSIKNSVTHTYKSKLQSSNQLLFVTITWYTKLICQGFYITVSENIISLTGPHQEMSQPKGHKWLNSKGSAKIEVYWDLSGAMFEAGPEPLGSFYIVIVLVDSGTGLIIGDREWDPVDRGLLSLKRLTVVSQQYEVFTGQWINPITTRVRFCDSGPDHEITVRCCPEDEGPRNPVLSVLVDKKRVVRVKRLNWNFRGNQVIFVDGLLVDVMWDVYGWYFDNQNNNNINNNNINNNNVNYNYKRKINNGGGNGLFMFRVRSGLDSRLWLEEEEKMKLLVDKNHGKTDFSLLICASSKKPG